MKQKIFTLLLISAIGLVSCRKDKIEQNINQYDDSQIQNYISANGITGMQKDASPLDSPGIYYKIIMPGDVASTPLDYPDQVSFVFTLRSLDGKYTAIDTIQNHHEDFLGHLTNDALPYGLQIALRNIVKYKGASARLIIPSHLAYGVSGYGTGSSQNANSKIAGNQSLDYYVHVIENYPKYDKQVIKNNFDISTYSYVQNPLDSTDYYYYKILTPGSGTSVITSASSFTATYTGSLLNGTVFDGSYNGANISPSLIVTSLVPGVQEALQNNVRVGTKISMIIPSSRGYGNTTSGSIPINSVLRFTFLIVSVTP
ncbi:FKBP-type peptidyl-prolyl cis-trans isomerase [Mucilaginibacter sp. OK098]|uniref:FKBP-type peptidyl-prolyl cis-trans isomerase n=1 Tax=Mucilaginibacter sp. OK098 TaxID=1855297 RepID=UPI000921545B|nr:FKBP-type peptidyl-prolyl cis-trans isomerase [Mucilaginibacter sp. OK098]SHN07672.1 FKBP-type peptidyl-prolyl cis-trans isomerase [Mucilaginibacter sp. OK098]